MFTRRRALGPSFVLYLFKVCEDFTTRTRGNPWFLCYNFSMSDQVIVPTILGDTMYPLSSVAAADRLIELKRKGIDRTEGTKGTFWDAIDEIIKIWMTKNPIEYQSHIIDIKENREKQGTKFGTKKSPSGYTSQMRRKLDIPFFVERTIRMLYSTEELEMDKKFFDEFWKRYPQFRISERS